jgi:hypothetical protein
MWQNGRMNIKKVQRETVLAAPAGSWQDRRWFIVAAASRRCSLSEQRRPASATFWRRRHGRKQAFFQNKAIVDSSQNSFKLLIHKHLRSETEAVKKQSHFGELSNRKGLSEKWRQKNENGRWVGRTPERGASISFFTTFYAASLSAFSLFFSVFAPLRLRVELLPRSGLGQFQSGLDPALIKPQSNLNPTLIKPTQT